MKRLLQLMALLFAGLVLVGCAHPINMNADLEKLDSQSVPLIQKSVGYYIPEGLRTLEVTTPGGGGDKVRYFPYRDLEPGFYKALSVTFASVSKLNQLSDRSHAGVQLIITPTVKTTSYSGGAFTWPPTDFTVELTCSVQNALGEPIKTFIVVGQGKASFSEFKANFSLAAVRASNDALTKLVKHLREDPDLRR